MKQDLISLLSDYINKKPPSEAAISQELLALVQSHQVSPIIYYQTRNMVLYSYYLQAISAYTQRKVLVSQIKKALSDIPFFIVKGISIAQYYPVPQLRTMGDCDIIVHEMDKARAKQILISLGFEDHTGEWDDMEWHFQKLGLDFELHHRLLYDETVNTEVEKVFADSAWNYVTDHELDINFHFVYLLLHLKKHMLNRGVGIRQFMDLAVMSKNAELDSAKVMSFLQRVGLTKFAGVCSALCLQWFGIALPVEPLEISEDFFASATETILSNGVFGFATPADPERKMLNEVRKNGKIRSILSLLFPTYRACCITPKYKWINGKPFLLPVLWIIRVFQLAFSGKTEIRMKQLTSMTKCDESLEKRNNELMAWGL